MKTDMHIDTYQSPQQNKGFKLFLFCAIIWFLIGGILLLIYGNDALFKSIHSHHNSFFDVIFDYYTYVGDFVIIGPVLLLVWLLKKENRNGRFFLLLLFTQLFPFLIVQGIKLLINAPRPSIVFGNEEWFHKIKGLALHAQLSFPSGHTAGAFSFFTLLSILLPKNKSYWAFVFFLLAILVAYSRMYLGQHFFEDIYVGSIIGALFSSIFYIIWFKTVKK